MTNIIPLSDTLIAEDNPDLPLGFIQDILLAMKEIEVGEVMVFTPSAD